MERSKQSIGELIKQIAKDKTVEIYSLICKVTEINETERTVDCEPLNGSAEIYGVRLQPDFDGSTGIVEFPKKDSNVIVTFINKNTGFVSTVMEPEKILIDCDEIIFNGGSNDGLVIVGKLVSKINALENKLNALQSNYMTHAHIDPISGSTGVLLVPFVATPIAPITMQTDIENTKIKH